MIKHICDYCGKMIDDDKGIICSLPIFEKIDAKNDKNQIICSWNTNKILIKETELCPECAQTLIDFCDIMKEWASKAEET